MSINTQAAKLSTFALVMLIIGAVDNIRNLPAAALFGSTLIFFFVFSAIVFLIPSALVSAELASSWTDKGGICYWIKLAFGDRCILSGGGCWVIVIHIRWIHCSGCDGCCI